VMQTKNSRAGVRRVRNAEATRTAIVRAAIAQFAEEGFAKASIDRIAKRADVTKGAVYHHFTDKAQLFEGAFIAVEDRFLERLDPGLRGIEDPRELLATSIGLFLAQCREIDFLRIAVLEAPAALGWERWKELEGDYLLGVVTTALAALNGEGDGYPTSATMVIAASSAAGLELHGASPVRVAAERERLAGLIMRMVDCLGT
jgi:AcrR family transcriptional regulator